MRYRNLCVGLTIGLAVAASARANVVFSEVLFNEVGSNTAGEFMEIYNNGPAAVDLSNYKVGDLETQNKTGEGGGMLQFPAGTSIAPGQVYTIASGAVYFNAQYGFNPSFDCGFTGFADPSVPQMTPYAAWTASTTPFAMANGGDQAVMLDGSDSIVDAVSWGNTFAFDPGVPATSADGQSIYRVDPTTDTNTAADWAYTSYATGVAAAARSTPGVVTTPEPAALSLLAAAGLVGLRRRR